MVKHPIEIQHKSVSERHELRHGLGLMALETQCPWLEFDCRQADCGICVVKVIDGAQHLSPPSARESDYLQAMGAASNERLACQCRVFGPVQLLIDDYSI